MPPLGPKLHKWSHYTYISIQLNKENNATQVFYYAWDVKRRIGAPQGLSPRNIEANNEAKPGTFGGYSFVLFLHIEFCTNQLSYK